MQVLSYLWQVTLHSCTMGIIFYGWVSRVGLPSGRTRMQLLALLLTLPLVTAAIPGRAAVEFGERLAWFNSARLLAVPLPFHFQAGHVMALAGLFFVLVTVWQEVLPALRPIGGNAPAAPDDVVAQVRAKRGWECCDVRVTHPEAIALATGGRPGRPTLLVSRGALEKLTAEEFAAVLTHEHAHWLEGRWWRTHLLFAARLLQACNPAALWAFREYCNEVELECDAAAVAEHDSRMFARILLRLYQETDGRDVAARAALRRRVDELTATETPERDLPPFTVPVVALVMLGVLPWLV